MWRPRRRKGGEDGARPGADGSQTSGGGWHAPASGGEPEWADGIGGYRRKGRLDSTARIGERRRDGGRRRIYAAAGAAARGGSKREGRRPRWCPEEARGELASVLRRGNGGRRKGRGGLPREELTGEEGGPTARGGTARLRAEGEEEGGARSPLRASSCRGRRQGAAATARRRTTGLEGGARQRNECGREGGGVGLRRGRQGRFGERRFGRGNGAARRESQRSPALAAKTTAAVTSTVVGEKSKKGREKRSGLLAQKGRDTR